MNWKKRFVSQKLNVKFTLVIILFMVIPIGILAGILFYNMEKNVVSENTGYMEYTMERNKDAVATKINSINMSTQFFLSDEPLLEMLKRTKDGETFSAEEWYSFKNSDIVSLERLVNNNPLLYGVRVYASNDRVQEMMPILYAASRMEKQPWQSEETVTGWHYDFNDQIFNSYTMRQNRKILSLVTEIKDSDSGTLGMIEAAMTMENMFPSLYENIEDEWSCFLTEDGGCYFGEGDGEDENTGRQELLAEIMAQYTADEEIQTCYLKLQGQHLIVSYLPLQELNGTLLCVKNITSNIHHVYRMRNTFVAVMLVFLVVLTFFINAIVKHLLKQLYEILRAIRRVQGGDLDVVIEHCEPDEMGELGTQINKMLTRIKQLMDDNLKREMLVKNYMALINLRFDYEIYLSLNLPEIILQQEIPKMSLQPIVENAIYHGIEQMAEDTNIYIKGRVEGNDCVIEITDAGRGMTEEEMAQLRQKIAGELDSSGGSGNGIGLKNVQDRIQIAFGGAYGIEVASQIGCYTKIIVRIPMTHRGEAE